jgi:phosphoadenosine phosphosulfate reductase
MAITSPDLLEHASAEEVLDYGVRRFHPRLAVACSFQKEESVLLHMLTEVCPDARVFTIDTGVLFEETLETWRRFEERFEIAIEAFDARSPGDPWTLGRCCGTAKVQALEAALRDAHAWVTGIRREQAPTRAGTAKLERDRARGIWKLNPIADWSEQDVWGYVREHALPYNALHDRGYGSIGCVPCTLPGRGRAGRWAGLEKTECGIHEIPVAPDVG